MPNSLKDSFLQELTQRFGAVVKLPKSNSLFEIGSGLARIYIRYSKVHPRGQTFFGLRQADLLQLAGHNSFVVFLWPGQPAPLLVPYAPYEPLLNDVAPAADGQFKAQIYISADSVELYIARLGRFNLEGLFGWTHLEASITGAAGTVVPVLDHFQMQSIIAAIGAAQGYDIWIPSNNRGRLDPTYVARHNSRDLLPLPMAVVRDIMEEIDIIWLHSGSNEIAGMFEVEHTTPIYTALLRFNDVHLVSPNPNQTFRIMANEARRALFVRHLNRPTFTTSGLHQICTFLEYRNVFGWYQRTCRSVPLG